jgi:predicted nuclease of restriction endonuclease-like (RecB) superfamily
MSKPDKSDLYTRIRTILESARTNIARSVNSTQVIANWFVGREIIEDEQHGKTRATYGHSVLPSISLKLQEEFGIGYSIDNLELFRRFYTVYPDLIPDAVRRESTIIPLNDSDSISDAVRRKSQKGFPLLSENSLKQHALRGKSARTEELAGDVALILHASRGFSEEVIHHSSGDESWRPGRLNQNLSWTHYRALIKVKLIEARSFYEIESIKNGWSARQLERQIDSLLFERLLKSRDKKGVLALSNKGLIINKPIDIIKDPIILEFLDLPESHRLVESKLETALISKLKDFLLELGSGFAYVGRQKRLTLEGDHFYSDLVFYHIKLKCYVVIDLKTRKLTHGDLGQMLMYVNYFDRNIKTADENPTIGLILCTNKNDAVAEYVLGEKQRQIFTSRYQHELPTVEELKQELQREMEMLSASPKIRITSKKEVTDIRSKAKKEKRTSK